jgi:hypothetical protein
MRVAEYHTYFVGGPAWGLAVWSHNAKYRTPGADDAAAPNKPAKGGIYEFPDQTSGGTPYVGQSSNVPNRLNQHQDAGRLSPGTESTTPIPGGKTAREIAEHNRIQQLTGGQKAKNSPAVSNKVDPIGPKRRPGLGLPEPQD